jgi:hypothetical protein
VFPNEPIRVGPSIDELAAAEAYNDEAWEDGDPDERGCMSCEDGYVICDGTDLNCPEADDSGCYRGGHVYRCTNCGGSGLAKDQTFW